MYASKGKYCMGLALVRKLQQAGAVDVGRNTWKDAPNCLIGRRRDALQERRRVRATLALHSSNGARHVASTGRTSVRRLSKRRAATSPQSPVQHLTDRVARLLPVAYALIHTAGSNLTGAAAVFHLTHHHGYSAVPRGQRACSCWQGRDAHCAGRLREEA